MARKRKMPIAAEAKQFGARLAELRRAAGYTQRALAAQTGISQRMIAYYEKQADYPPTHILLVLAKLLGVSVEALLDTRQTAALKRQSGPTGKVREVFERVAKLPSRQQEKIVEFISAYVNQYEQSRAQQ